MSDLKIGLKVKEELMRKAAAETTVVRKSLRSKPEQVGSSLLQVYSSMYLFRWFTRRKSWRGVLGGMRREGHRRRKQAPGGQNPVC